MTLEQNKSYDYIVVGAGSAGCAVAGRLGEKGYKVLLLEAGGRDSNPWIHIPLGYSKLYDNPSVNWCYESQPEPNLNNRRLFQPRGKVLGGTGAINGMIYMRGQPQDFDDWKSKGCTGWGWEDVLPFFKSCEDQERGASYYHGVGGPVSVSDLRTKHQLGEAFHAASERLGVPRNNDFNGPQQEGTGYVQTTTRKGLRWSTADGYLKGHAKKHVKLQLNAMVERVLIENKRAVGVEWTDKRGRHQAYAKAEVILCGGAFNSPQLLQLSGIGPGKLLQKHGIDLVQDLPGVGENLQDHFGIGVQYRSKVKSTVNDLYNNPFKGGSQLLRFLLSRTGPFSDNGNYSNTFIRSSGAIERPDMMLTLMSWCTDEKLKPYPFSGFTILAEHMRPSSFGHVRISGNKPTDRPEIQFNLFSNPIDQLAAINGLKFARKIAATAPMTDCIDYEISPGKEINLDDELIEYCRKDGLSLLHSVGTCKMGVDKKAVVNPRLKVHGIERLRVIDASIMPNIITGNTNATTIMIGEKGAALILEDSKR